MNGKLIQTVSKPIRNSLYNSKSTASLLNSLLILKVCGNSKIVEKAPLLLEALKKVGLKAPTNMLLKNTMFAHFCGKFSKKV